MSQVFIVIKSNYDEDGNIIDVFDNIQAARECLVRQVEKHNNHCSKKRRMERIEDDIDCYYNGGGIYLYIDCHEVSSSSSIF